MGLPLTTLPGRQLCEIWILAVSPIGQPAGTPLTDLGLSRRRKVRQVRKHAATTDDKELKR